ncbi:MAG: hypothetical protein GY777_00680 [Candidatus Brocadiaceae bacterium]|nr:hypothetical protein [Candidatus Brocadiaceae bacterium]
MKSELDTQTHKAIKELCSSGDKLAKRTKYEEAKSKYIEALKLVPEPRTDWEAATWIYTAIGDASFSLGKYEKVMKAFTNAVQCPGGLGNPFVHLRLGQSQFELGNEEKAADELTRAYMGAGKEIFEEDDPKYFEFLKTVIKPPMNGKW